MLSENEDVISFYAGSGARKGQLTLGRIVVHDRIKVEAEILPRYFNHSSFASLRRQLNYFSFTRIGKGRQRGAVYENEGVIELEDILRLRRRSALTGEVSGETKAPSNECNPSVVSFKHPKGADKKTNFLSLEASTFPATLASSKSLEKARKKPRLNIRNGQTTFGPAVNPPKVVSPRTSPLHLPTSPRDGDEPKSILDLTVPLAKATATAGTRRSSNRFSPQQEKRPDRQQMTNTDDAEVLAGCRALLCFSQGLQSSLTA
jgi:HSF-type DNA-binding